MNISKIASFQHVINIKLEIFHIIFYTKFSKSGVYFTIIAHLSSD